MGPCVDWRHAASAILDTGVLPAPPAGSLEPGVRHPLAFDREGDLGAISFAVVDLHPRIAKGMWCETLISFFGIALVATARLTVTPAGGAGALTVDHRGPDG